ncbi:MAG: hypothetical protein ACO3F2_01605 [Roseiflexaceae bacterium]
MKSKSLLVLSIFFIASLLLGHSPSYAQQRSRISIEARVGFDNFYVTNMWTPVTLILRGDTQDRTVVVDWLVNDDLGNRVMWEREINLPAQTTKELHINLVIPDFARNIVARIKVDENILASTLINAQSAQTSLNVVVSDDANLLKGLSDVVLFDGTSPIIAVIPPNHLPDTAVALQGITNLFIDDLGQLNQAQHDAIQLWMELGGHLIVADNLSGTLSQNSTLSLDYGTPHTPQLTADAPAQLPREIVIPSIANTTTMREIHPGSNLLWQRSVGRGSFNQTTVPFGALRDWNGLTWLWRPLLQPAAPDIRAIVGRPNIFIQNDPLGRSLNIDALNLPHPIVIFLFIVVYIALIGPLTYLILKRRYTLDWAWVSIPVTAIVVTLLLAITGFVLRGGSTIIYTLSIVQQQAQATHALVSAGSAIYTPFRTSYVVDINDADAIAPIRSSELTNGLRFVDDTNAQIVLNGDIGSVQAVHAHRMSDAPLTVTHQLTANAPILTGTIQISGSNLQDVVVFYGTQAQFIGATTQNEPFTVAIDDTSSNFPCDIQSDPAQPIDQRRLYEVVAGYCSAVTAMPDDRVIIYGWSNATSNPPTVQAASVTAQRQLHIITVNLP